PAGNPLPPFLPQILTATISDQASVMLLAKYTNGPLKLYAGYEWIQFLPPSNPQTAFNDIAGDFLCLGCAAINNTNIINTAFDASAKVVLIVMIIGADHIHLIGDGVLCPGPEYLQNLVVSERRLAAGRSTPFHSLSIGGLRRSSRLTPGSCSRKSIMDL